MDSNTTEGQYQDLREDFRMDVEVPFAFHLLDEESTEAEPENIDKYLKGIEAEVSGGSNLASALRILNDKLSSIISVLDSAGKNISMPDTRDISISVGGVGFRNDKPLMPDEKLRLTIGFPPIPYTMITTHGAVIRSEEMTDETGSYYMIAVKFQQLDEEERQDITRFLFNAQRKSAR
ncbi:MAG: PilZ domain-containing protein [Thermodesulfobacteriota bacterium]